LFVLVQCGSQFLGGDYLKCISKYLRFARSCERQRLNEQRFVYRFWLWAENGNVEYGGVTESSLGRKSVMGEGKEKGLMAPFCVFM